MSARHDHGHHGATHHTPGQPHAHPHDHGHAHPHDHGHAHPHAHPHDHGSTWWGRLRHAVAEAFGAHSHDPADQVDDTLEANAEGRRALLTSLLVLAATAVVQGAVVAATGSVALLGDTLHNVADALTAVPLLVAFRLGTKAATTRFTYGYGRAEDLAGLFVVAMIALSSAVAGYEAIRRLVDPQEVAHVWAVAAAAVVGFVGNEVVARYRIRVGRRIGSAALVADGLHARTDGFTSLAVLVGAVGAGLGWRLADPLVGLVITLAILGVLRSAVVHVGGRLMDAVDPAVVEHAAQVVTDTDGVTGLDRLQMRWLGHTLTATAHITVLADSTSRQADEVTRSVRERLTAQVRRLGDVTVQTSLAPMPPRSTSPR